MSEILRRLPGSSLLNASSDTDLASPEMARALEAGFGGGGYSALQRAVLLQLTWEHVSSGLDGRESAFELHANGGVQAWRDRLRSWFDSDNDLANGVHQVLSVEMPTVDMNHLKARPHTTRRAVDATQATGN